VAKNNVFVFYPIPERPVNINKVSRGILQLNRMFRREGFGAALFDDNHSSVLGVEKLVELIFID